MTARQNTIRPGRVLLLLGLGMASSLMGSTILYIALPTQAADLGIALGLVGVIFSVPRVIRLLINGPVGLAFDRWPHRRLFVPALFFMLVPSLLYATTQGVGPFLVARLLGGLAWPFIWIGGTAIIMTVTTDQDRGRWVGLYQVWYFVGTIVGTFASGFLVDYVGFRSTMWIAAAVTLVGGLPALFLLPETQVLRSSPPTAEVGNRAVSLGLASIRSRFQTLLTAMRQKEPPLPWYANRGLWAALLLYAINGFVTNGVIAATTALLVQDQLPNTNLALGVATATGLLGALRLLLSLVTAPLSGTLSDRLGKRWGVILGALVVGAGSMILLGVYNPAAVVVGIVAGALAGASLRALLTALIGDLVAPAERGRALGVLNVSGDLGIMAGPVVAYALLPWLGLPGIYLGCAGLYALGAVVSLGSVARGREIQRTVA